ncbi:fatty acid desaturase [Aetokthonos hydrillicola Thurmond2011]|jgi:fatty acid desaturase|uniref:Fatty acid desaturase n=1 Tax=Aetokthonos hydrillicola Thurmond2011 TaxID=2712845 RepID=A0AAP5IAC0_9CYAN|nr:fatty acid desaturase [Aetokthonos hydrillicola]MBO3458499.1 fatty acid desaturase [Aetokthonos hydrillicola CCALA 1050]MBW4586174.1 fatty acid desaturase [Aetokthonos hydrillicola CCALA 1050]MDR9897781.1 fatty acid desaturase [Aetokthonos hydrillicola Thurmond2011]
MPSGKINQLLPLNKADATTLPQHQILSKEQIFVLNKRSNYLGAIQLGVHLLITGCSGYLYASNFGNWLVAIPALIVYGFCIAAMFAPMHEAVHRTAFANNRLNDIIAWLTGLLSYYNSTFFRYYHKWHHLYTRIPGKDPELTDMTPKNWAEYILVISGLPWWFAHVNGHFRVAIGLLDDCPFIPLSARTQVIRSTRLHLAVYVCALAVSILFGQPWFFLYWLLPLFIGQPILRFILLAEHTGCTLDNNLFTNTRTTLTLLPMRLLMWNMSFHAEHHLYPSIPFHALPKAHQYLNSHLTYVDKGYTKVNQYIISKLGQLPSSNT